MNKSFFLTAEKLNTEHRRTRRWHKVITVMAAIVVFCTTYALILPAITWERSLLCDTKEHTHTTSCYAEVEITPETKELTCSVAEHIHGDSCYEEVTAYVCGLEEDEAHRHTTDCMQTERVLNCEQSEHTHGDSCYHITPAVTERQLVCTKPEHVHTDACFDAPPSNDSGYYCGHIEHAHSKDCYFEDGSLRCTVSEHTHSLSCQINKTADLETANEWERTFADVALKDNWAANVLAIADTQLGYTESTKNFVIDDETTGAVRGYTRYGTWYGDPYGDWCAMFAAFCIDYAGVKDFPLDSNCGKWIEALADKDCLLYHPAGSYPESYMPRPGDLIFFDWDAEKQTETAENTAEKLTDAQRAEAEAKRIAQAAHDVDHVGLVYELIEATETTPAQIKTIEGNNGNVVAYHTYDLDDVQILGYGQLPENPERRTLAFEGSDFRVEVMYTAAAGIPENAQLSVRELLPHTEEYHTYYKQMVDDATANSVKFCRLFDISFLADGREIEPAASVTVNITYDNALPYVEEEDICQTIHFTEHGMEELATEIAVNDGGQDAFVFTQDSFSVVANLLMATTPQSGTFYQRVDKIDSTTANYLMVSAEGNYALVAGNSGAASIAGTAVKLEPVKGNAGYYTISNVSDTMRWRFGRTVSSNGGDTTIRRGNNGVYLYQTRAGSYNNYTYPLFSTTGGNENLTYNTTSGTWTINGTVTNATNRYVSINNGTFSSSNATNNTYQRNMLILKEVSTTLNIPDDVSGGSGSGSGGEGGGDKPQPTYNPDTSAISGAKQGEIDNVASVAPGAGEHVTGSYASDPATSNIEDQFFSVTRDGQSPTVNDGKVLTDKSVIYKGDDYGAFPSYADDTFGVALSVLGQDYQLKTVDQVKIPVDVVFILDVSGSMGNAAGNVTRREAVVNAVNSAMTQIMKDNTENRAGVVLYSSGGSTLLGLDHYAAGDNGQYLNYNSNKIRTASNLSGTKSGPISQTFGEVNGFTQSHGTYTQYGIALGAKLLQENGDTTYTTTLNPGTDYAKTVTVTRQPVMILLSDGDPTHCTNNYTDVLSGPAYGDGAYPSTTNNKGIQGYYTILSANYYKRMVGIHYDVPATFYTIGMGIYDGNSANKYKDMSGASSTGDCYKRAVLNPTAANISDLLSNGARTTDPNRNYSAANTWSISCQMLNQLLGSSYGQSTVTVGSTGSYSQAIGVTNTVVPVLSNPYSDSYNYADGAYFGNLSQSDLQKIFGEIISGSLKFKTYGYMLYKGTSVEITDEIGEGMEIKGTPVLRYNGKNYALEKVRDGYICRETATTTDGSGVNGGQRSVDLSEISIKVTTVNGKQTVRMEIPDTVVPSYTPDMDADWYYEELPVRLIYQVGLTERAKTAVANLAPGKTLTYYTNSWGNTSAGSVQTPHQDNPYYNNVSYDNGTSRTKQYTDYSNQKTSNVTGTAATSSVSTELPGTESAHQIKVTLGNNGKLEFHNDAPSTVFIDLYKVDMNGKKITTSPAQFKLYDNAELTHLIGTYETADGELTISDLIAGQEYWLKETRAPDGFYLLEEAQKFTVDASGKATGIASDNAYFQWDETEHVLLFRNSNGYELPQSGGSGLIPVYACGALLMAGALMYGYSTKRKGERRQSN